MNPSQLKRWSVGMNSMGRPFITALVTTIYNLALLSALVLGVLDVMSYITAVGPTNAMIIGFWFGERKSIHDRAAEEDEKCS
jgi:hypothetical protein